MSSTGHHETPHLTASTPPDTVETGASAAPNRGRKLRSYNCNRNGIGESTRDGSRASCPLRSPTGSVSREGAPSPRVSHLQTARHVVLPATTSWRCSTPRGVRNCSRAYSRQHHSTWGRMSGVVTAGSVDVLACFGISFHEIQFGRRNTTNEYRLLDQTPWELRSLICIYM